VKLPSDSKQRKEIPLTTGCLDYFPKALAAVAMLSKYGNDKHNPGQPLHWSRDKSTDHADCAGRHLVDRDTYDDESDFLHAVGLAWRSLALLEILLETMPARREIEGTNIDEICQEIASYYAAEDPLMAGAGDGNSPPWVPEKFVEMQAAVDAMHAANSPPTTTVVGKYEEMDPDHLQFTERF
jgi:hypothetical protein